MKFTAETLRSTSKHFEAALNSRGLGLPFQRTQNLWAQITVGKNYSAASAQAKAQGSIEATRITAESICGALKAANRVIDSDMAVAIFGEAIAEDLEALSSGLSFLYDGLDALPASHLRAVYGDQATRLGLMDAEHPGYIPVASLIEGRDFNVSWMRENSEFVAKLLNHLSGRSEDKCVETVFANIRASSEKHNRTFEDFVAQSTDALSEAIAREVMTLPGFSDGGIQAGADFDYDEVRIAVLTVFEQSIEDADTEWLKVDCDMAEAVIDHVAGRIRDELRFASANPDEDSNAPGGLLAYTAGLAMKRLVKRRPKELVSA